MFVVCELLVSRSELVIKVAPIAIRAAFSNIHTWTVLKRDLQLAGQVGQLHLLFCVIVDSRCFDQSDTKLAIASPSLKQQRRPSSLLQDSSHAPFEIGGGLRRQLTFSFVVLCACSA
jgi:hypothetical protein